MAIVLVAFAGVASAHASLVSTDPASGARVAEAPRSLTLVFTEPVEVPSGAIRVLDARMRPVPAGPVTASGATVTVALPALGDGGYAVTWRVVSADSHPVSGAFTFAVGNGTLPSTLDVHAPRASRAVGVSAGVVRWLQYGALAVLVGVLAAWYLVARDVSVAHRVRRVALVAGAVGVVTALAGVGLQAANQRAGGLGDAFSAAAWRDVVGTRFGVSWSVRAAAIAALGALGVLGLLARRGGRAAEAGAALLAVVAGATVLTAGHSSSGRWRPVAYAADAVHLAAMALWVGALVVLVLSFGAATEAGGEHGRHEAAAVAAGSPTRRVAARVSPLALGCVAALALSGVVQGWRQSGTDLAALWDTAYGRLLVGKVVLVVAVLVVAARVRASARADAAAGDVVGTTASGAVLTGRDVTLTRYVLVELLGIGAVLALTAGLAVATPPRSVVPTGPVQVRATVGAYLADVELTPGVTGRNELHLQLYAQDNAFSTVQAPVDEVTASLRLPSRDVGPIDVTLVRAGPAHFIGQAVDIPFAGSWRLDLSVRKGEFDLSSGTVTLRVR